MNHRLGSIEGNEVETRGRAWRGIGFEREEGGGEDRERSCKWLRVYYSNDGTFTGGED